MLGRILKKALRRGKSQENPAAPSAPTFKEKSEKFFNIAKETFEKAHNEIFVIRGKLQNLRQVNYDLGMKHLENGHLKDAIFRFRFIKKFWPDHFDAYYQLAYCLALRKKPQEAKIIIEELLSKKPDYSSKAQDLLQHIENSLHNSDA